jgi:TrmH family RNA methyltransferase
VHSNSLRSARGKISFLSSVPEFERLSVVLVSTRNPLNIGAAARAMSNFGFSSVRLVNPYEPSFREARSAVGAAELLASAAEFKSIAEAVADCSLVVGTTALHNREVQHPVHYLPDAAPIICAHLRKGRVALLFGSEKTGLSNDDLSYCHWLLHIPAEEQHLAMNLGQAVAVCLYELARRAAVAKAQTPAADGPMLATAEELDRLSAVWLETLRASGYVNSGAEAITEEKLLRMLRRINLSADDAKVWMGMLRQVIWKLNH